MSNIVIKLRKEESYQIREHQSLKGKIYQVLFQKILHNVVIYYSEYFEYM